MSTHPNTGDANLDNLVTLLSAWSFRLKFVIFPLVIVGKCCGDYTSILFLGKPSSSMALAFIDVFHMNRSPL